MDYRQTVEANFSQPQKCSGHCDQPATLRFLVSGDPLVACHACPAGYVSKVMTYGSQASDEALRAFLARALGRALKEDDIRKATRHSWDTGVAGLEMKAAYWTQNYRGSKSDAPDRPALFLCSNCGSTYVKPASAQGTTCLNCKS